MSDENSFCSGGSPHVGARWFVTSEDNRNITNTALVAGGAGYIGSHICKALAESGTIPVCYDTLEKGNEWAVRWGSFGAW